MAFPAFAAVVALGAAQAPQTGLQLFGLGAIHWYARRDEIARAPYRWAPTTRTDHLDTLIVPGRVAYVRVGRCEFAASLEGAYGGLTHVLLDLNGGDRARCARDMIARATKALGAPERSPGYPPARVEQLAWRSSGDLIRVTNVAGPYGSLMVDLTTRGDRAITFH